MAEQDFKQVMQEAVLDADSLEQFINGDDTQDVLTRLSKQYPTLQKAIKELFKNIGIAQRFKTLAELQSSSLNDGDYALVADDTDDSNNGVYTKEGGEWVKSKYDVSAIIESYTEDKLSKELYPLVNLARYNNKLVALVDGNGLPIVSVDENGEVSLQGIRGSVQWHLNSLKGYGNDSNNQDIIYIFDATGNTVAKVDKEGDVYLQGLSSSVQDLILNTIKGYKELNNTVVNDILPEISSNNFGVKPYSKEYSQPVSRRLSDVAYDALKHARFMYKNISPIPNLMLPQDFSIGSSWVDDVQITTGIASERVPVDGYDPVWREDIGVVHPQVWSFNEKVFGYRYWLGLNPYTNGREDIELPFIYGSNDPEFKEWHLIDEFPAPFEEDPIDEGGSYRGHLSDSGFAYDVHNGDLIFFWRKVLYFDETFENPTSVSLLASRFNGQSWSDNYYIFDAQSSDGMMSPNILYNPNDNLYYMYNVDGRRLYYRTSPTLSNGSEWSSRAQCALDNQQGKLWHLDAKIIGDKVVMLLHGDNYMSNKEEGDVYYFAVSSDFKTFKVSSSSIDTNPNPEFYKATFEPIFFNNNTAKFRIIYTSDSQSLPKYQMYVTDSNTVNLGV